MSCSLLRVQGVLIALNWAVLTACSPQVRTTVDELLLPRVTIEGFSDEAREQIRAAHRAAEANSDDPDANGRVGMVLQAYEQYESAAACYRRALHFSPESFRWMYYLAVAQATLGRRDEAIQSFSKALELRPQDLAANLRLAELLSDVGDADRPREILSRLIERHPQSAGVYYRLGQLHSPDQDPSSAIRHYRKALELDPRHSGAHYGLAQAYGALGRIDDSQQHLALYEQSDPNRPRDYTDPLMDAVEQLRAGTAKYHLGEGRQSEAAGKLEEAVRHYQAALAVDPDYFQAHVNLISVFGRFREFAKAEHHYRESLKINPNVEEVHYNYGVLLLLQDRYREAAKAFQRALEINPWSAHGHNNLGIALEQTGRSDEAVRHYRLALKNQPNYRLAHYHLGRYLASRGAYQEAIDHLQKSLSPEDEETPFYLYVLAQVYAQAGDSSRAADYLDHAREKAMTFGQKDLVAAIDRVAP